MIRVYLCTRDCRLQMLRYSAEASSFQHCACMHVVSELEEGGGPAYTGSTHHPQLRGVNHDALKFIDLAMQT